MIVPLLEQWHALQMMLLSDGSVTRHLQLMAGTDITAVCTSPPRDALLCVAVGIEVANTKKLTRCHSLPDGILLLTLQHVLPVSCMPCEGNMYSALLGSGSTNTTF